MLEQSCEAVADVDRIWKQEAGDGPLIAVAAHAGHAVREEVAALLALDEAARRREEDPFTDRWTSMAPTRVVGRRSRFEVDLNRPRDKAVYRGPEEAWGLEVWKKEPSPELVARSLAEHDLFYAAFGELLSSIEARHGHFVLFDLHTYNHRRAGPDGAPAEVAGNPQVNLGTRSMDRQRWAGVINRFMTDLRSHAFPGGGLDVRENVRFGGGHIPRWVHRTFPRTGCPLAIEVKKFFMDEWSGQGDEALITALGDALAATVPGVLAELARRRS